MLKQSGGTITRPYNVTDKVAAIAIVSTKWSKRDLIAPVNFFGFNIVLFKKTVNGESI